MPQKRQSAIDNSRSFPQNNTDNVIHQHQMANLSREEQIAARDEFIDYFTDLAARVIFKIYMEGYTE